MKLRQVLPSDLFTFLTSPGASDLLAQGVKSMGGRLDVSDVLQAIQAGTMQLWAASDAEVKAVLLSELKHYPKAKVLQLFGLAGSDLPTLVSLLPGVEAFARQLGCTEIGAVETRAGLELAVPGLKRTGVCFVKSLEPLKAVA